MLDDDGMRRARLDRLTTMLLAAVTAATLAGCATTARDPARVRLSEVQDLGGLRVVILDAPLVDLACQSRQPRPHARYTGCYVPAERLVISRHDVGTLLHELKHVLDPDWRHD